VDGPVVPGQRLGWRSPESLIFMLLLVLHLVPIWSLRMFPTQDGPSHQAVAQVLRLYDLPEGEFLHEYYLRNREASPNEFIFFLMARVLGFVPVPAAEKILLSVYVLLLPLSVLYALRAVAPRDAPGTVALAALAFPFTYNFLMQMGFFNFCFSLAAFFFALGFWWRRQGRLGLLNGTVFAVLVLWVYFCHVVSMVMLLAVVGTVAAWRVLVDFRGRSSEVSAAGALREGFRRWLVVPLLAFGPALALMAWFVGQRVDARVTTMPLSVKVKHLGGLYSLVSLDANTVALSAVLAALFAGVTAVLVARRLRRGGLLAADGLFLAVLVATVAYFAAPSEMSGGGFLVHRLNLYPFLLLIPWFATFDLGRRAALGIQAMAALIAVALLSLFWPRWEKLNGELSEYLTAADRIEAGSTLLPLVFDHRGKTPEGTIAFRTRPFLHASGYIAARKPVVDLALYEAKESYFPLLFRPDRDPYTRIGIGPGLGLEGEPPRVDFLRYPELTGGRVDYVLLSGLDAAPPDHPDVRSIQNQLAAAYEPVYVSPRRLVRLYRHREAAGFMAARAKTATGAEILAASR